MTNEEFKHWIDGYLSLSTENFLNEKQFLIIMNHASLVKAVDGKLEPNSENFIRSLELIIKQNKEIALMGVRTESQKSNHNNLDFILDKHASL